MLILFIHLITTSINKRLTREPRVQNAFFNKDEHKVEHRTIFNTGIYMHLRN